MRASVLLSALVGLVSATPIASPNPQDINVDEILVSDVAYTHALPADADSSTRLLQNQPFKARHLIPLSKHQPTIQVLQLRQLLLPFLPISL